jgi:dihydrofolate reductase
MGTTIMKLTTTTQVSVDGVIQGNGGRHPDLDGGFDRGGWAGPLFDNEAITFVNEVYQRADAFLFGRRTYELFAGYWGVREDLENAIVGAWNMRPKYVASKTLTDPQWADTTVLSGDVAAAKDLRDIRVAVSDRGSGVRRRGERPPTRDARPEPQEMIRDAVPGFRDPQPARPRHPGRDGGHQRVQRPAPGRGLLGLRRRPRVAQHGHPHRQPGWRGGVHRRPFVESKEFLAGFWILEAPDIDVTLRLAAEGSKACNRKIEVRPFL